MKKLVLCLVFLSSCVRLQDQTRERKLFEVVSKLWLDIDHMLANYDNVNVQNEEGMSPLLYVAQRECESTACVDIVKLLEAGADPNIARPHPSSNSDNEFNWKQYRAHALVYQNEMWCHYAMNCLEDMEELYKMESRSDSFRAVESFYINLFLVSWGYAFYRDDTHLIDQPASKHTTVKWLQSKIEEDIPEDLKQFLKKAIQQAQIVKDSEWAEVGVFDFEDLRLGDGIVGNECFYSESVLSNYNLQ